MTARMRVTEWVPAEEYERVVEALRRFVEDVAQFAALAAGDGVPDFAALAERADRARAALGERAAEVAERGASPTAGQPLPRVVRESIQEAREQVKRAERFVGLGGEALAMRYAVLALALGLEVLVEHVGSTRAALPPDLFYSRRN